MKVLPVPLVQIRKSPNKRSLFIFTPYQIGDICEVLCVVWKEQTSRNYVFWADALHAAQAIQDIDISITYKDLAVFCQYGPTIQNSIEKISEPVLCLLISSSAKSPFTLKDPCKKRYAEWKDVVYLKRLKAERTYMDGGKK